MYVRCVRVALRKESVDRNRAARSRQPQRVWSLSARRAWIEIVRAQKSQVGKHVALRKESVDRNFWSCCEENHGPVALRKESVDRNHQLM